MALGYAILSLLERSDASGYDLMKSFDSEIAPYWHATHPQIYRELARLERERLVSHRLVIQRGRPNKKVFSITRAGKVELRRWAAEWPASAPQINDAATLRILSLPLLAHDEALALIRGLAAVHRPIYERYKAIQTEFLKPNGAMKFDLGIYLTLLRGLTVEKGYLEWCQMAEAALAEAPPKHASERKRRKRAS